MSEIKYDTSPYAYAGFPTLVNDPYAFGVDSYNGESVAEFIEDEDINYEDDPYSIFGLGKTKKKAEKKLARAEKKLSKGKTKAAARLQKKAGSILSRIGAGQQAQAEKLQYLQDINIAQSELAKKSKEAELAGQLPVPMGISEQPMTEIGSSVGISRGGATTAGETTPISGVENDEPTGDLAKEKELPEVQVVAKRKKKGINTTTIIIIIIAVFLLVAAVIYFKSRKK